ncbi:MAG: tripartite tricarboxylate transporter substrate binding protein [Paracoccus sp. (in: a-proteobacteria)]|uniref:Bug family tripartite tricarboxylate transporter substrate binding protein n=1 Tax=Paracoccus sp. TaxID=267 RepID=UPI0039E23DAF
MRILQGPAAFLGALMVVMGLGGAPHSARAGEYPDRPVKLIVGYQAGSINDIAARLVAEALHKELGQPFIVENHPGATGTIADRIVASAPADGHTLLIASSAITTNAALKSDYTDFQRLKPITTLAVSLNTFVGAANASFADIATLIAHAKENPGELLYATSGIGSSSHLVGEAFQDAYGIKLEHVPYPSASERNLAIVAGEVDLSIGTPFLSDSTVRQLGVLGHARTGLLPDVPTLAEQGYPLEVGAAGSWVGVFAPSGTPDEVIARLYPVIVAAVGTPDNAVKLRGFGFEPQTMEPSAFEAEFHKQIGEWRTIAETLGLRK